ncbi:ribosome-associated protein [Caldanaerobius fijiensis DSM 17918]|uniref:Ribosome-associated protein n=1 Tax=Caldanaerobius fijiensis DSM 17918 TaxID=1121256 RepID=A0A1M5AND1_9THEO|nr:RNA-binding S4 domain-containing protein [Caldanaerobius fijiensis]SHF31743.1 ribosome-associated protein [Caldanaerobius fijiensis DSM 17918]
MNVKINTDYIKLEQVLKLANVVPTGGQAKLMIKDGHVKVNGSVCLQRGKKIRKGDVISVEGQDDIFVI